MGETALHPPRVLAVVGPTASGKSALAEELGVRLDGEIVSADSMQVYRAMDIGTAKTPIDARRVPLWCVDIADPGEPFSAALFQKAARDAIGDIASRGKVPVLAGGTGLYVRAALDRMEFPSGHQSTPMRAHYESIAAAEGGPALHALLTSRDPESAAAVHPNNVRRVVRALEMLDEGVRYADKLAGFAARSSVYDTRWIGLHVEREELYRRIGARVDGMLADGLLGEVSSLLDSGFRSALTASQAIGYKELVSVVEGESDLNEAVEAIKQATRRYAKRQLTWFRADPRITWIDTTHLTMAQAADTVMGTLDWSHTP
jgi:tRNA dimethylallyltransferase